MLQFRDDHPASFMRPVLLQRVLQALLLIVLLFTLSSTTARRAWQWNTLSIALVHWIMTPDPAKAQHWETQTAAFMADVMKTSSVWSSRQRERLQVLESMLPQPTQETPGLQILTQMLDRSGMEAVPATDLRVLLNKIAETEPMFPIGAEIEPGWRLLGFDLVSYRIRPTKQEPILLYWERSSGTPASPGSLQTDGWRVFWSGRRVYQFGTITKLISHVWGPRSLPVGTFNVGFGTFAWPVYAGFLPIDSQGQYVISIRMRVHGGDEALGCARAYVRGPDQEIHRDLFCSNSPNWTQATVVLNLQRWSGEWRDMLLYVINRSPGRPGIEVQFDNAVLFPLDIRVLARVPSE